MTELRAALLTACSCVLVVLWPLWLAPGQVMPGHPTVDVWTHAWGLGWVADSLIAGSLPTQTAHLGFPRGGAVTPADPLGGVLLAPVTLLFGVASAMLAEVALQVGLAALGGWFYGRTLAGAAGGALVAVACATSPTFTAEVHNGILEAGWIGLVPLAAALAARGSRWTPGAVALAAIASPYLGVSAAVLAGLHLVAGRDWRRLVLVLVVGGLAIAAATFFLRAGLGGAEPLEIKPAGIQEPTLRINAVDPRSFFWPGDHWSVPLDGAMTPAFRRTPYLGWALLLAAGVGLWRGGRRWLLVPVLGGSIAALGAYLWWGDGWFAPGGRGRLALPMLAVMRLTDGGLDHPLRFLAMAIPALAALAARGAGRWAPLLAGVVLVENLAVAPNVWPLASVPAAIPLVYGRIPDDGRPIIDLPSQVADTQRTGAYLYWQTSHGHPLPYTLKPNARVPDMNPALRTWLAIAAPMPTPKGTPGWIDPASDLKAAVVALAAEGYGWVVLHRSLCRDETTFAQHREAVSALLGAGEDVGGDRLWEVHL